MAALQTISKSYHFLELYVNTTSRNTTFDLRKFKFISSTLSKFKTCNNTKNTLKIFLITEPLAMSFDATKNSLVEINTNRNAYLYTSNSTLEPFLDRIIAIPPNTIASYTIPFSNNNWWANSTESISCKTKDISLITSDKSYSYAHCLRRIVANGFKDKIDVFNGGNKSNKDQLELRRRSLSKYRYSLVIENSFEHYHISSQIMDTFLSYTIPIYWGGGMLRQNGETKNFLELFDQDGIIYINEKTNLNQIVKSADSNFYDKRIHHVLNNRNIVMRILNTSGWNEKSCLYSDDVGKSLVEFIFTDLSRKIS